jgi:hypothetical protein
VDNPLYSFEKPNQVGQRNNYLLGEVSIHRGITKAFRARGGPQIVSRNILVSPSTLFDNVNVDIRIKVFVN